MLLKTLAALADQVRSLGRPHRPQAAALCWRHAADGSPEILLVTTRQTGRWTPPKGNLLPDRSAAESAALEAWEEAGVRGTIAAEPLGRYCGVKRLEGDVVRRTIIDLYPLQVTSRDSKFPERRQRRRRWFTREEAAGLVDEADLAGLIRRFEPPPPS